MDYPKAGDCTRCQEEFGRGCCLEANTRACWTYEDEEVPDAIFVPKAYKEADMW